VKIDPVTPVADEAVGRPGTLTVTKRDVHVATASGTVRLGVVQGHGKKPMPAADWARGIRIEPGERFGDA
jgi:methionyl-tRNA formyltransferase